MSLLQPTAQTPPAGRGADARKMSRRTRPVRSSASLLSYGEPMIWLTGGALATALFMILGLLALVVWFGMVTFWPLPVNRVELADGRVFMGEITRDEIYRPSPELLASLPPIQQQLIQQARGKSLRYLVRTGNYELTGEHFNWVSDFQIAGQTQPAWALVVERLEWGRFYGYPKAFLLDDQPVADQPEAVWAQFQQHHAAVRSRWQQRRDLETNATGKVNARIEDSRLSVREAELQHGPNTPQHQQAARQAQQVVEEAEKRFTAIRRDITQLNAENHRYQLLLVTADGKEKKLGLAEIVRAYPANQLSWSDKAGLYLSRWWEFVWEMPREANSEGGVFPAIFGTVVMTLIMSLAVVPFGVLAAMYLREYAKPGPIVSAVRIAVNNLAGVPSIVFGVFGLGFFCYFIGAYLDGGPANAGITPMPSGAWYLILGLCALVGTGAFLVGIGTAWSKQPEDHPWLRRLAVLLWLVCLGLMVLLLARTPFFHGFFRAGLPNPTYGKGGLIWASFTLALLTLPVVIVATEEALAAVPGSMREGSYACGASKWQTIWRIVLPRAMPGVMTGMILAMARGAGEVAPLMLVGAVKLTEKLALDRTAPFLHPDRSFMHLGFHIYDLGFQSQNSEAAKPMVYTTTLLLILLVALLNLSAIWLRSRLRRRFQTGQF